ncbi:uncharacterized protein N7482_000471 [Penicillium canariense]|uniref:C2H2-type domain-containing protein n=1 Tax=Penicillium canariense TaxID=189055 RepID=A0A9W9IBN5_9EURO|nr:uncharacterized protein N7482_000471 [Penicillium canariense]KAJ5174594.1 hypothetical protein N7482_000471 [Penicillium canariense]
METGGLIEEAAQLCVERFTQCLKVPALMENEWAENRLADMKLWISGTGACARGRAALDSRLASRPEARDVIANLLHLLGTVIDDCRMQSQTNELSHSYQGQEDSASSADEGQGRAFSPWSDDSSCDDQSKDAYNVKASSGNPLRESMYNVESMQDQLARIAVAVRRSGRRSRLQKADQRFNATEHQELEGHLLGMLLTQLKWHPGERDSSKLNEVQLRLIHCNLKRRNRFLYAQQHSRGLDAGSIRRTSYKQSKQAGWAQEEIIGGKPDLKPSNDGPNHANNTTITGTSASKVSDNFKLQPDRVALAASSIISTTAIDLDYPRPPRFDDDAHLFRKHITDDLSPYTCILAGCDQPDVLFSTKETWKQHMLNDHSSATYWICFACGDGSQFNDKQAFLQHLKSKHAATIPPDQISVLVELSKKTTPAEIPRCPLCNWPEEEGANSDERIHDSSEKVYSWLIQNEIQAKHSIERPSREKRIWHSEYFQQNAYFAGSSKASSSSEPDSDRSRENELEELRRAGESIVHETGEAAELASQGKQAEEDIEPVPGDSEGYTVGWICAIATEYIAAQAFLDERHLGPTHLPPDNQNAYTLGRIGKHNVVISVMPMGEYGSSSAARVVVDMLHSFPNICLALMVGIGGGAPSPKHDIRLGDIVVGIPHNGRSGVIQYDFGHTIRSHIIRVISSLNQPPTTLRAAVTGLAAQYEREGHQLDLTVSKILEQNPRLRKRYGRPDCESDRLYQSHIIHVSDGESPCISKCGDDPSCLVSRIPRTEDDDNPAIHYGLIVSANQLMKDALIRDKMAAEEHILCFETGAAGLMNHFPCLVIRGICDYADSHKNKSWQGYAAMEAKIADTLREGNHRKKVTFGGHNSGIQFGVNTGTISGLNFEAK